MSVDVTVENTLLKRKLAAYEEILKEKERGMVDSRTSEQPVTSFVLTNVGLEAGVSVQGAKVSRAR